MKTEMYEIGVTLTIRKEKRFANWTIFPLTAKAMKGDWHKGIHAVARDYVILPVVPEKLLSVINIWLGRSGRNKPQANT